MLEWVVFLVLTFFIIIMETNVEVQKQRGDGTGIGVILGIILALVVILVFLVYGIPGLRDKEENKNIDIQVPDKIDVNVGGSGGNGQSPTY